MTRRDRGNAARNAGRGRPQPANDSWDVEGVVEEIGSTRFGRKTLYNLTLDDGERYGAGESTQGAEEGDFVRFQAYENKKGYLTISDGSLEVDADAKPAPAKRGGNAKPNTNDSKRRSAESLQYVDARNAAIAVLNAQVEQGIVNLGAKNKVQERSNAYWGLLDDYTAMFYEETETLAALDRAGAALSGGEDDPEDAGSPDEAYDD